MGIPFEMITMLGSTVLGGVMSIWSQKIKAKESEQKLLIERNAVQQKALRQQESMRTQGFNGQDVSLH